MAWKCDRGYRPAKDRPGPRGDRRRVALPRPGPVPRGPVPVCGRTGPRSPRGPVPRAVTCAGTAVPAPGGTGPPARAARERTAAVAGAAAPGGPGGPHAGRPSSTCRPRRGRAVGRLAVRRPVIGGV